MSLLGRYLGRPAAERRILRRALTLVLLVRAGLWLLPFGAVRDLVARSVDPVPLAHPERDTIVPMVLRAVRSASLRVPKASCLTQALAAERLLAEHGIGSRLRIGVTRDEGGRFKAHAWLEQGGEVVLGRLEDLDRYVVLPSIDERPDVQRRL